MWAGKRGGTERGAVAPIKDGDFEYPSFLYVGELPAMGFIFTFCVERNVVILGDVQS